MQRFPARLAPFAATFARPSVPPHRTEGRSFMSRAYGTARTSQPVSRVGPSAAPPSAELPPAQNLISLTGSSGLTHLLPAFFSEVAFREARFSALGCFRHPDQHIAREARFLALQHVSLQPGALKQATATHWLRRSTTKPEGIARADALKRSATAHAKAPARTFRAGAFDMSANARKRQPTFCELSVTCAGASRCGSRRKWRRHR